jgi:hypothetical protein
MQNERMIVADDYGFFLLSMNTLETFLGTKKIRTKNLLQLLSQKKELLQECIQNGVLLPINQIAVCAYKLYLSTETKLESLETEWSIVLEEGVFNLKIGIDQKLWFVALAQFNSWDKEKFLTREDYSGYWVESGSAGKKEFEYIGQRFDLSESEYLVKVFGLKRKDLTADENKNYGYFFDLKPTKSISENIIPSNIAPNFNMVE